MYELRGVVDKTEEGNVGCQGISGSAVSSGVNNLLSHGLANTNGEQAVVLSPCILLLVNFCTND